MKAPSDFIPFARPSIGREEEEAVLEVLRSGWLTTGKVARAFEEEFAAFLGTDRALAVNSATSALHLALEAVGIGPGMKVAMSPYTFASDAAVVRHLGAEVAFCDISENDYNIDPALLSDLLDRDASIKAVIPVHIGGMPCKMNDIMKTARDHNALVIEDCAHAFPLRLAEGMAGTLGDLGFFSFYATKTITTAEGGMLVGKKREHLARIETMRSHGFDRSAWDRYTSATASWRYDVVEAGYKYNLPDMLAAVGREQLKKADRFLARRRAIAEFYTQAFSDHPVLEPPPRHPAHAWHLYSLRIRPAAVRIERDEFAERLQKAGIGISVHFIPLHVMTYWSRRYNLAPDDFPRAYAAFSRTVSLPIWPDMSDAQVEDVVRTVLTIAEEASV
jgi:dTDP-4-amino-4,6-dideoxygalactose transaminase